MKTLLAALEAADMYIAGESNQDKHDCLDQIRQAIRAAKSEQRYRDAVTGINPQATRRLAKVLRGARK